MTAYTVNLWNWSGVELSGVYLRINYNDANGIAQGYDTPSQTLPVTTGQTPTVSTFTTSVDINWFNLFVTQPQGSTAYTVIPDTTQAINVYFLDDPDFATLTGSSWKDTYTTPGDLPSDAYIVQGDQYMAPADYSGWTTGTIILTQGPDLSTLTEVDDVFAPPDPCAPCTECSQCPDCAKCQTEDDSGLSWWWWVLGAVILLVVVVITGGLIWKARKSRGETEVEIDTNHT